MTDLRFPEDGSFRVLPDGRHPGLTGDLPIPSVLSTVRPFIKADPDLVMSWRLCSVTILPYIDTFLPWQNQALRVRAVTSRAKLRAESSGGPGPREQSSAGREV